MNINLFTQTALFANIIYSLVILLVAFIVANGLTRVTTMMGHRFHAPAMGGKSFRAFILYGVFIIAILIILGLFGLDTNSILAVLGTLFGLVAIGFVAVWSVLSNFLCTTIILALKTFRVGDTITIPSDNVSGKVKEINMMFTKLESSEGEYVQIPNNLFFQRVFKNKPESRNI